MIFYRILVKNMNRSSIGYLQIVILTLMDAVDK